MNMPLLLFENQVFDHSVKRRFQRKGSCKEAKWMPPVPESSIGNSYKAPKMHRRATIEASIKYFWNPSHR